MAEENLGPAAGMDKKGRESQKKRRKTKSKTCEKRS